MTDKNIKPNKTLIRGGVKINYIDLDVLISETQKHNIKVISLDIQKGPYCLAKLSNGQRIFTQA